MPSGFNYGTGTTNRRRRRRNLRSNRRYQESNPTEPSTDQNIFKPGPSAWNNEPNQPDPLKQEQPKPKPSEVGSDPGRDQPAESVRSQNEKVAQQPQTSEPVATNQAQSQDPQSKRWWHWPVDDVNDMDDGDNEPDADIQGPAETNQPEPDTTAQDTPSATPIDQAGEATTDANIESPEANLNEAGLKPTAVSGDNRDQDRSDTGVNRDRARNRPWFQKNQEPTKSSSPKTQSDRESAQRPIRPWQDPAASTVPPDGNRSRKPTPPTHEPIQDGPPADPNPPTSQESKRKRWWQFASDDENQDDFDNDEVDSNPDTDRADPVQPEPEADVPAKQPTSANDGSEPAPNDPKGVDSTGRRRLRRRRSPQERPDANDNSDPANDPTEFGVNPRGSDQSQRKKSGQDHSDQPSAANERAPKDSQQKRWWQWASDDDNQDDLSNNVADPNLDKDSRTAGAIKPEPSNDDGSELKPRRPRRRRPSQNVQEPTGAGDNSDPAHESTEADMEPVGSDRAQTKKSVQDHPDEQPAVSNDAAPQGSQKPWWQLSSDDPDNDAADSNPDSSRRTDPVKPEPPSDENDPLDKLKSGRRRRRLSPQTIQEPIETGDSSDPVNDSTPDAVKPTGSDRPQRKRSDQELSDEVPETSNNSASQDSPNKRWWQWASDDDNQDRDEAEPENGHRTDPNQSEPETDDGTVKQPAQQGVEEPSEPGNSQDESKPPSTATDWPRRYRRPQRGEPRQGPSDGKNVNSNQSPSRDPLKRRWWQPPASDDNLDSVDSDHEDPNLATGGRAESIKPEAEAGASDNEVQRAGPASASGQNLVDAPQQSRNRESLTNMGSENNLTEPKSTTNERSPSASPSGSVRNSIDHNRRPSPQVTPGSDDVPANDDQNNAEPSSGFGLWNLFGMIADDDDDDDGGGDSLDQQPPAEPASSPSSAEDTTEANDDPMESRPDSSPSEPVSQAENRDPGNDNIVQGNHIPDTDGHVPRQNAPIASATPNPTIDSDRPQQSPRDQRGRRKRGNHQWVPWDAEDEQAEGSKPPVEAPEKSNAPLPEANDSISSQSDQRKPDTDVTANNQYPDEMQNNSPVPPSPEQDPEQNSMQSKWRNPSWARQNRNLSPDNNSQDKTEHGDVSQDRQRNLPSNLADVRRSIKTTNSGKEAVQDSQPDQAANPRRSREQVNPWHQDSDIGPDKSNAPAQSPIPEPSDAHQASPEPTPQPPNDRSPEAVTSTRKSNISPAEIRSSVASNGPVPRNSIPTSSTPSSRLPRVASGSEQSAVIPPAPALAATTNMESPEPALQTSRPFTGLSNDSPSGTRSSIGSNEASKRESTTPSVGSRSSLTSKEPEHQPSTNSIPVAPVLPGNHGSPEAKRSSNSPRESLSNESPERRSVLAESARPDVPTTDPPGRMSSTAPMERSQAPVEVPPSTPTQIQDRQPESNLSVPLNTEAEPDQIAPSTSTLSVRSNSLTLVAPNDRLQSVQSSSLRKVPEPLHLNDAPDVNKTHVNDNNRIVQSNTSTRTSLVHVPKGNTETIRMSGYLVEGVDSRAGQRMHRNAHPSIQKLKEMKNRSRVCPAGGFHELEPCHTSGKALAFALATFPLKWVIKNPFRKCMKCTTMIKEEESEITV